ncbi:AAA family ATPase [Pseudomonas fluorescens]|uniref:AAA family ATPase n=1 Tax=Pseudomonas fluorescens TaxID=294 RepID=UPI0037F64DB5
MESGRLLALTIENFKSLYDNTRVEFGQLTVFLGRNNSGKSTITQALLLLKQTLELARVETVLNIDGYVSAISLRELISGWPETPENIKGPFFSIEWSSQVNIDKALESSGKPDLATLMDKASLPWLADKTGKSVELFCKLDLQYCELNGKIVLEKVSLTSSLSPSFTEPESVCARIEIDRDEDGRYQCHWDGVAYKKIEVDLHHFIPSISIDRRNIGPRNRQRSLANAFNILFSQPLDSLESMLKSFAYLSSTRGLPLSIYSPNSSNGEDIGISGEFAAQLLYTHKEEPVHYLIPNFDDINTQFIPKEQSLAAAINEVLFGLGIDTPLSIHEIEKVGFRLMFGKATFSHVGRGLTYLLPIVQLGLFSDPMRFKHGVDILTSAQNRLCAFEEPESHLHPKVQGRLATWFVSLARANRQVIVETHSDHMVRRLRKLLAQAKPGSEIEKWLSTNIRIVSVNQIDGKTSIESGLINRDGSVEVWPTDFMDAAVNAEQEIYYAALDKEEDTHAATVGKVEHMDKDEPDAFN